jgi:hypothetical protein
MVAVPSDVTISLLLGAKTKDLHFWIKQANTAAGRRVLTLQGTVDVLRGKTGIVLGLDLTTTTSNLKPEPFVVGLVSMDLELQRKQWAYLRELGREWEAKSAQGELFILVSVDGEPFFSLAETLHRTFSP